MRSLPAWCCIGTESGVHHSDGGLKVFILQIRKELPQLSYKEHTFIYNCSAGQGYYISIVAALFKYTADNIELPVKIQALCHFLRPLNERLHNTRHTVNSCFSQYFRVNRDFSPSKEIQTFFLYNNFKNIFRLISFQLILGKKEHSHSVIPLSAESDAKRLTDLAEESVGNLQKNSHAVSGLSFRILSCSVFQVFHNPEGACNSTVAFHTFNIYNCTDPAVIMFKTLTVQSLPAVNFFPHNPCPFFCIFVFYDYTQFFSICKQEIFYNCLII